MRTVMLGAGFPELVKCLVYPNRPLDACHHVLVSRARIVLMETQRTLGSIAEPCVHKISKSG